MTKRRAHSGLSVVVVAFAASCVGIGRVAAQQTVSGAAACTALGAATFTAVATLTATYDAGNAAQPAHCVVRGSAAPRTGVDGKPYETRFELRLPTDWSGRFLYQGGGGNDGIVAPAVGRNTGSFPGHRTAARLRGGDDGCGTSGRDRGVRSRSSGARRSCLRRARTNRDDRLCDRVALLRPRTQSEVFRRLFGRWTAGHDVRAAISRRTSTASRSARRR